MVQNRKLLASFLAILVAVGAMDGVRCVGKYAYRLYLRHPFEPNASPQVVYGNGSTRLVQSIGYHISLREMHSISRSEMSTFRKPDTY